MNIVLVLAVVVGSCVCEVQPQHTQVQHHLRDTVRNPIPYISGKERQVLADREKLETKRKEAILVHVEKPEIQKDKTHNIQEHKSNRRFRYTPRDTEAKILDMNKRYPSRGKLKRLPGLVGLKQEETPQINATFPHHSKDCSFICPQAESLAPCLCDPCTRAVNCSAVVSFEQLFDIFHTTYFPNLRFESFLLVSPLKNSHKTTSSSDTFLANTFGEASFASIWVESMAGLRTVEAGAFLGLETTLKSLVFRWNYGLTYFPFKELGSMEVLHKLEVSGSSFTSLPAFPAIPKLANLYLDDNFIKSIPPKTFTELSSLMYLDLGFNNLYDLVENSLHFSATNVIVYLDHNNIEYIDENTFSGKQPILLDVSCNDLIGLNQLVFQPILDLIIDLEYNSYVDATCNPLQCPYISWLLDNSFYLYFVALPDPPCTPAS